MLESFKRLFTGTAAAPVPAELRDAADWARVHGFGFRRVKEGEGFVIDGVDDGHAWRIEWGPPQRPYIEGRELRLRIELGLPSDLQMLVLSRALMERLERQTYEQFVEDTQTQIDTTSPEEMRWLVMFPKVGLGPSKAMRTAYGACAAAPAMGALWLDGALAAALERAIAGLMQDERPFVLMTLRGRLYLRLQMAQVDSASLDGAFTLFAVAAEQALRVAATHGEHAADWPTTGSTAWQTLLPEEPKKPT